MAMAWTSLASFTKEVYQQLAKRPLVFNGRLDNCGLTSLVKLGTAVLLSVEMRLTAIWRKSIYLWNFVWLWYLPQAAILCQSKCVYVIWLCTEWPSAYASICIIKVFVVKTGSLYSCTKIIFPEFLWRPIRLYSGIRWCDDSMDTAATTLCLN